MQNELIIVSEYCDKCHIEPSFIEMLQEIGLIDIRTEGGERCLLIGEQSRVCSLPSCRMWNVTAVCITTCPSTSKVLMPFIICWSVWKVCSRRFILYIAG